MLCAQVTWMFEQTVGQFGVSGRISYQADIVSGAVTLIANREGPRYLDRETIERVATDYGDLKAYFELFGYEVTAQIRILGGLRPFFAVRSARALRSWRNADYVERITIRMRAA